MSSSLRLGEGGTALLLSHVDTLVQSLCLLKTCPTTSSLVWSLSVDIDWDVRTH